MHYIGFDIGGSRIKAVLVKNKKIIKAITEKLPKRFDELLDLIKKIAGDLREPNFCVGGAGFSLPGPLDLKRETVLNAPNINYLNNQPLKKLLEQKLRLPVKIEHDIHCFLLAEKEIGLAKPRRNASGILRGKNYKNVFYITLGTGIGGAWMFERKIYFGAHGSAGEIGHTIISSNFSEEKLERARNAKLFSLEDSASNKIFKKLGGADAENIFKSARKGDKKAKKIFQIMGENLGVGLANLVNILDPEIIILGGGIAQASAFFLPFTLKTMKKYIISPLAKKEIKIAISKLPFAGALGAALLFDSSQKRFRCRI